MTGIKRPIPINGIDLLPNMYSPGISTSKKENIPFSVVLQQVGFYNGILHFGDLTLLYSGIPVLLNL